MIVIAPFALKPSDLFLSNNVLNGFFLFALSTVVCMCVVIIFVFRLV